MQTTTYSTASERTGQRNVPRVFNDGGNDSVTTLLAQAAMIECVARDIANIH